MGSNCSTPETPNQENIFKVMLKMNQCGNGANELQAQECSKQYKNEMQSHMDIYFKENPSMSHCTQENRSVECRKALSKYLNNNKPVEVQHDGGPWHLNTSAMGGHCSKALGNILHEDPTFKVTSGGMDVTLEICKIYVRSMTGQGPQ